ncbi:hypothetical protein D3C78_1822560 [compost metagenome]
MLLFAAQQLGLVLLLLTHQQAILLTSMCQRLSLCVGKVLFRLIQQRGSGISEGGNGVVVVIATTHG